MNKILLTLLFFGSITSPLQAKEYLLSLSTCELGSSCKKCVEKINLSISVDKETKVVTATGKSIENSMIREVLKNCEVHSVDKWRCKDYQSEFSALDGKIFYRRNPSRFVVDGTSFEVCSN
jgi:hypothetical protein